MALCFVVLLTCFGCGKGFVNRIGGFYGDTMTTVGKGTSDFFSKEEEIRKKEEAAKKASVKEQTKTPVVEEESPLVTLKKAAELKTGPSSKKPTITTLTAGTEIEVRQVGKYWAEVKVNGKNGWIRKKDLP